MTPCPRAFLVPCLALAAMNAACQRKPPATDGGQNKVASIVTDSREVGKDFYAARVEIDVAQFERNLAAAQRIVGAGVKVCAVMKGNAYGHGIDVLMPSVIAANVHAIGITNNGEARVAREAGFKNHVVRLRLAVAREIEAALPYDMEEMAGSLETMKVISDIAVKAGKTIKVHVNLNSAGMSRNGIDLDRAGGKEEALAMLKLPGVEVVGLMTHFPGSESDEFRRSAAKFKQQAEWLVKEGGLDRAKVTFLAANSAAMEGIPEAHFDMVRPGSFIYGAKGNAALTDVQRLMRVKSEVAGVMHYPTGNTVSYDRTFTLTRDSRLANVPIGWSDGYGRELSNVGFVLVRGKRFPVVGRVTMNTILVDVTEDPEVRMGDEVVLAGKQGSQQIGIADFARGMKTIPGQVTMSLGGSLPKVAVRGDGG